MKAFFKFTTFSLLGLIAACTKQEDEYQLPETARSDYMQLKTGNYWIFKEFKVSSHSETDEHYIDSVYVEKDTMIRNKLFYKLIKPSRWQQTSPVKYLSDSLDYVVDHNGNIVFSSIDFTSIFNTTFLIAEEDTIAKVTRRMTDREVYVTTPAGMFRTSSFTTSYAVFPSHNSKEPIVNYQSRYADGVGMVSEVVAKYLAAPEVFVERRLIRWKVK